MLLLNEPVGLNRRAAEADGLALTALTAICISFLSRLTAWISE